MRRNSLSKKHPDEDLIEGEDLLDAIRYLDPDLNPRRRDFIGIVALLLIASLLCVVGLYLHVR